MVLFGAVLFLNFFKITVLYTTTPFPESTTTTAIPFPTSQSCPPCPGVKNEVNWPNTTLTKTLSEPPCVDDKKELIFRSCTADGWGEEPKCSYIQKSPAPSCPEGFVDSGNICYTFTNKSIFPPKCPYVADLPFSEFYSQISDIFFEPVWIPATRDLRNGLGYILWTEVSSLYKKEYPNYNYDTVRNKDCLVFDSTKGATAVSCSDEYRGVCAYTKLSLISNAICLTPLGCHQSDYNSRTRCFCTENNTSTSNVKAEFRKIYQNSISFGNTTCNFGLEKTVDGRYIWNSTGEEIDYTYWSADATFDEGMRYGTYTPNGWILTKDTCECSILELEMKESEPELQLTFDNSTISFTLKIINDSWLQYFNSSANVLCFTDAQFNSSVDIYSNSGKGSQGQDDGFTFQPTGNFPGNYWCEAFKFSDFGLIQSQIIFHRDPVNFEFVGIFRVGFSSWNGNPLSSEIVPFLNEMLINKMEDTGARIMKIVDLDEETGWIFVNLHFSLDFGITDEKKNSTFYELKETINKAIETDSDVEMVNFSSADFCIAESSTSYGLSLHWPTIDANEGTFPEEFCFLSNGSISESFCIGNFMDGFQWYHPKAICTILQESSISPKLLKFYNQNITYKEDIEEIIQLTPKITPLDVYLTAEIYKKYSTQSDLDMEIFSDAVESFLQINREALYNAQIVASATDNFLETFTDVLKNFPSLIGKTRSNFLFLITKSDITSGIAVDTEKKLLPLSADWQPEDFENFDSVIWLTPQLRHGLNNSTIVFTMFFNDFVFNSYGFDEKNVTMVYGLILNSTEEFIPGPVKIFQRIDSTERASCEIWRYNVGKFQGSWTAMSLATTNFTSFQVCDFWQAKNFGFVFRNNENVTSQLEDLLTVDYINSERLNRLAEISEKHQHFVPVDVLLVGQILDLVESEFVEDLVPLVRVVDNLHKINKSTLSESQEMHGATDLVLSNIDDIVKNFSNNDSKILHTTDNFIVSILDVLESDFIGLILHHSNSSLQVDFLKSNFTLQDYNVSSVVLLSPELQNQIPEDSKIIFTVFFSDVLFNERESNYSSISKIFGVILPDVGNYSGPLTIIHNISETSTATCAHWNYGTDQIGSYWRKDNSSGIFSSLTYCDFWHTTHFGLLIFNDERYEGSDIMMWITMINSGISLFCLFCIVLTAVLFEKWRRNLGNQILLNFSFAIILQIIIFYIASAVNPHSESVCCTVIGILLHYTVISQFCWTLTVAILQFKRFVTVFVSSPKYLLLKTCLCGWVLPWVFIIIALVINHGSYVTSTAGLCYPEGMAMYIGVWVPILSISGINLIIFVYIIYSVIKKNLEHTDIQSTYNDGKHQWRLFLSLFFMLGLTWLFGLLAGLDIGEMFAYLFSFTATLQGFVLFFYFIVCNGNTRKLYINRLKKYSSKNFNLKDC